MAWKFDNPLFSLTDEEQNEKAKQLWEREALGGITEDNNRLPRPVVWLLALTIVSAFLMTFPLWGQRPSAAIYADYVAMMDTPEIQTIRQESGDDAAMAAMVKKVRDSGSQWQALLDRHPLSFNELRLVRDDIIELKNSSAPLDEYSVIGDHVTLANFEGNWKEDGTRERKQPWWDKGYTIDLFYVTYFCLAVLIAVKRLPNFRWQPTHHGH
ncbi:MAG: hypothetical protein RBT81_01090 [Gammaproteobacteria bacterium]|jgi:hypothetical protein|nr:hypothetical protein [Gammaproteobacteria bacterium]